VYVVAVDLVVDVGDIAWHFLIDNINALAIVVDDNVV